MDTSSGWYERFWWRAEAVFARIRFAVQAKPLFNVDDVVRLRQLEAFVRHMGIDPRDPGIEAAHKLLITGGEACQHAVEFDGRRLALVSGDTMTFKWTSRCKCGEPVNATLPVKFD